MAEAIADMVIRIGTDVSVLKRDMAEVSKITKSTADGMTSSFSFVKSAFDTMVGGLTLRQLWGSFRSGVSELAALDDAAENAGTSVEKLGQLVADLAPSGETVGSVSAIIQQLNRSLLSAEHHTSRAGSAFKALGIETKDSNGNLKDSTDLLREIAVALDRYEDGTNKSQLATALLGRSGAQNIDMLKDLARAYGETNLYTAEMATNAELVDKHLNRLSFVMNQLRVGAIAKLLPELAKMAGSLLAISRSTFSLKDKLRLMFGSELRDDVRLTTQLNDELQSMILARQNMAKDASVPSVLLEDQDRQIALKAAELRAAQSIAEIMDPSLSTLISESGLDDSGKEQAPKLPDENAALRARAEETQRQLGEVTTLRRRAAYEYKRQLDDVAHAVDMGRKTEREALDEQQRLESEHITQLIEFASKEIAIKESVDAKTRDTSGIRQAMSEREDLARDLLRLDEEYAEKLETLWRKNIETVEKGSLARRKADEENLNALEASNRALKENIEAQIQAAVTGRELAVVEREVAIARLEAELAVDENPDPNKVRRLGLLREELSLYQQRAAVIKQTEAQKREKAGKSALGENDEKRLQAASDSLESSITDALMRGFENGKGFAENFRDTLKNIFMTTVLRPIIKPLVEPFAKLTSAITDEFVKGLVGRMGLGGAGAPITQLTFPGTGLGGELNPYTNFGSELNPYATPGMATGGAVSPMGKYIVGENGPEELHMGLMGGFVRPNSAAANMRRPTQIVNNVTLTGSGVTPQDVYTAMRVMIGESERRMADAFSRRSPAFRGS